MGEPAPRQLTDRQAPSSEAQDYAGTEDTARSALTYQNIEIDGELYPLKWPVCHAQFH